MARLEDNAALPRQSLRTAFTGGGTQPQAGYLSSASSRPNMYTPSGSGGGLTGFLGDLARNSRSQEGRLSKAYNNYGIAGVGGQVLGEIARGYQGLAGGIGSMASNTAKAAAPVFIGPKGAEAIGAVPAQPPNQQEVDPFAEIDAQFAGLSSAGTKPYGMQPDPEVQGGAQENYIRYEGSQPAHQFTQTPTGRAHANGRSFTDPDTLALVKANLGNRGIGSIATPPGVDSPAGSALGGIDSAVSPSAFIPSDYRLNERAANQRMKQAQGLSAALNIQSPLEQRTAIRNAQVGVGGGSQYGDDQSRYNVGKGRSAGRRGRAHENTGEMARAAIRSEMQQGIDSQGADYAKGLTGLAEVNRRGIDDRAAAGLGALQLDQQSQEGALDRESAERIAGMKPTTPGREYYGTYSEGYYDQDGAYVPPKIPYSGYTGQPAQGIQQGKRPSLTAPVGLESIWSRLNGEEMDEVQKSLASGMTAEEIMTLYQEAMKQ